ncbi:hypothetical protein VTI28DRAFT_5064 [Corynascus sepedonium]
MPARSSGCHKYLSHMAPSTSYRQCKDRSETDRPAISVASTWPTLRISGPRRCRLQYSLLRGSDFVYGGPHLETVRISPNSLDASAVVTELRLYCSQAGHNPSKSQTTSPTTTQKGFTFL